MFNSIKKIYILLLIGIFGFIGILVFFNNSSPTLALRVGINQWPGYETLFLARSLGYIESSSIKLVELPSATEVIHALRNDTLEAATLTLDETLDLLATGVDLTIVAVMNISSGADAILAQPKYTSLQSLKEKRIGVETNAVGAIVLDAALEQEGMQVSDFTIVPLPINKHVEAYALNKVEAVVTFEPVKTQLLSQGAVSLSDRAQTPGRIVDVLVVQPSILKTHTHAICSLITAQFQALKYFREYPDEATQLMAPRLHIRPKDLLKSYQRLSLSDLVTNRELLSKSKTGLQVTANQLVNLMFDHRLIKNIPNISHLIDNRCIKREKR
jgi:NitT/TauT family transport system substrate-binding protein